MCVYICAVHSRSTVSDALRPHGLYSPWNSPGQNTGVGSLSLLQGIFPTQGLNPDLPHCRQILYQLSHKGSPRILEWVAYPFSRGSSWPRNRRLFPPGDWGFLHCKQILHHLSHKGSARILECVAYPFSRGSSWRRNQTRVSCIVGIFFTSWVTREAPWICSEKENTG